VYHIYCTWLDTAVTITLVSKINAARIQSRQPFDTEEQFLNPYFYNQLWVSFNMATIRGVASN